MSAGGVALWCLQGPALLGSFWSTLLSKWLLFSKSPQILDGDQLSSPHDHLADKRTKEKGMFYWPLEPSWTSHLTPCIIVQNTVTQPHLAEGSLGYVVLSLGTLNNVRVCDEGRNREWMWGWPTEVSTTLLFYLRIVLVQVTFRVRWSSPCAHVDRTLVSFNLGWSIASKTMGSGPWWFEGFWKNACFKSFTRISFPQTWLQPLPKISPLKTYAIERKH